MDSHIVSSQWIATNAPHTMKFKYLDDVFESILTPGVLDAKNIPSHEIEIPFVHKHHTTQYSLARHQRHYDIIHFRIPVLDFIFCSDAIPTTVQHIKDSFPALLRYCSLIYPSAQFRVALQISHTPLTIKLFVAAENTRFTFAFFAEANTDKLVWHDIDNRSDALFVNMDLLHLS